MLRRYEAFSGNRFQGFQKWGTYGPELLSNGGMDSDTVWTKGGGWSIAGGVAARVPQAGATNLSQPVTVTTGAKYLLAFSVTVYAAGGVTPRLTGGTIVNGTAVTALGTHFQVLTAVTGNTGFAFNAGAAANLSIDNVSLRRIF